MLLTPDWPAPISARWQTSLFVEQLAAATFVFFEQAFGSQRFDDRILTLTPAQEIDLPAAGAAEWKRARPVRDRPAHGFSADRAFELADHAGGAIAEYQSFFDGFESPVLDFDSDFFAEPLSPPPELVFVSASAAFLYESLR